MQISDFQINASQILDVAKLPKSEKNKWLGKFRQRGVGKLSSAKGQLEY